MDSQRLSGLLWGLLVICFAGLFVEAYEFKVGGKDGWTLKPSENYNHWAERMRFQVGDTLCKSYVYLLTHTTYIEKICIIL